MKVRRKTTNKIGNLHNGDSDITSLYVSNVPVGIKKGELWKLFKAFGKVVDVNIPNKKNSEGSFFCFIKYTGIEDSLSFEQSLTSLNIKNNLLRVNLSKYPRKPPPPPPIPFRSGHPPTATIPKYAGIHDHRCYASALLGKNPAPHQGI
ncbi:hypothetical protein LXL04_006832 [Taraxacum kok-saghyz]